jgi:hypothetical protein
MPAFVQATAYDPALGVYAVFFTVARRDAVFVKLLLESYEGLGVVRTVERFYRPGVALQVMLAVPDMVDHLARVLDELAEWVEVRPVEAPAADRDALRADLLAELTENA